MVVLKGGVSGVLFGEICVQSTREGATSPNLPCVPVRFIRLDMTTLKTLYFSDVPPDNLDFCMHLTQNQNILIHMAQSMPVIPRMVSNITEM